MIRDTRFHVRDTKNIFEWMCRDAQDGDPVLAVTNSINGVTAEKIHVQVFLNVCR